MRRKHACEADPKVLPCDCEHNRDVIDPAGKYPGIRGQDELYGKGRRLHNPCKTDSSPHYRCTVCGTERRI